MINVEYLSDLVGAVYTPPPGLPLSIVPLEALSDAVDSVYGVIHALDTTEQREDKQKIRDAIMPYLSAIVLNLAVVGNDFDIDFYDIIDATVRRLWENVKGKNVGQSNQRVFEAVLGDTVYR